jgi:hypothetical protein
MRIYIKPPDFQTGILTSDVLPVVMIAEVEDRCTKYTAVYQDGSAIDDIAASVMRARMRDQVSGVDVFAFVLHRYMAVDSE